MTPSYYYSHPPLLTYFPPCRPLTRWKRIQESRPIGFTNSTQQAGQNAAKSTGALSTDYYVDLYYLSRTHSIHFFCPRKYQYWPGGISTHPLHIYPQDKYSRVYECRWIRKLGTVVSGRHKIKKLDFKWLTVSQVQTNKHEHAYAHAHAHTLPLEHMACFPHTWFHLDLRHMSTAETFLGTQRKLFRKLGWSQPYWTSPFVSFHLSSH